ncbi:MAG: acyl-ACP--UDP-N-acetylglucosamine O-acyltransferase [Chitinophagaceae bacterium]|nr:acyl-ACP--UDP-N-acetylglucosamine O-acyltransferase [Oligoflexus sp.]
MIDYNHLETIEKVEGSSIHPRALVYQGAVVGKGVLIGPNAVIGPKVTLHDGVQIGPGALVLGKTTVGEGTQISPYATVGAPPQDLKYKGEDTEVRIGKNNRICEYVNISLGTVGGGGVTTIGDDNLIMAYTHVAHDCVIGNNCVFANGVHLAGHVIVKNNVTFGGISGAHQFCRFGERAMVAAGSIVVQDVPPYCLVQGDRARISGLNVVGLRRSDLPKDRLSDIKTLFKILYNENLTLEDAIERMKTEVPQSVQRDSFIDFVTTSHRGICR